MSDLKEMTAKISRKLIENRYILNMEQYVFGILYLMIFFQILIGTKAWYSKLQSVSTGRIVGVAFVTIIFLVAFKKLIRRLNCSFMLILWMIWIGIQIIYIYTTFSQTGSDAYVINYYAYWISQKELENFFYGYFARYQNNIGLVWILHLFYAFVNNFISLAFEDTWLLLAVLAAIFADIAIYFTVKFSSAYLGKEYDGLAFVFSCLLIGLSEEGSIFYSDIVSLWTVPCFFYLLTKTSQLDMVGKQTFKYYIIMGVVLGIGGWLKPQVLICFIAYAIFKIFSKDSVKKKVYAILLVGSIVLMSRFLLSTLSDMWFQATLPEQLGDSQQYMDDYKYPMIHWLNMGVNYEAMGAYNFDDDEYTESIKGLENKKAALTESLIDRLQSHTMKEWCQYLNNKVISGLQNGSFSQEYVWKGELLNKEQNSCVLQKYFVAANDEYYNCLGIIIQTVYLLCMFGVAVVVWKKDDKLYENPVLDVGTISLLGIIIFLAIFERNIRYFYTYIPVIIVLGISSWKRYQCETYKSENICEGKGKANDEK